jgi:hypothetical protein
VEIPEGLDQIGPGPVLAALLSTVEVSDLSGYDRIVVLRADQRMASHYQARTYQDMASVADIISEEEGEAVFAFDASAAEIRAALCLTRRAADSELSFALDLKQRLPMVWESLASGDIDLRRARTIIFGTCHLGVETARGVVDQIIGKAGGLTTGQLGALLRKVCVQADPSEAASRYQQAVAERRVIMEANDTGTANLLGLDLPPHRVTAIAARITEMAKGLRGGGESRTMDQLRADILLDLLEGKTHQRGSKGGMVDIRVDLDTLAGLSETAGELSGFGPVIADIARQVVEDQQQAGWRWTVTHPDTGQPIHEGITRRRPNGRLRRQVQTRNRTCVFPGCRMPATSCDLDHRIPYSEGGPTRIGYLAPLCRHDHHRIRHKAGWKYRLLPNGDHQWTSRLGHTYTTSGQPP